jgi:hypothetical protein
MPDFRNLQKNSREIFVGADGLRKVGSKTKNACRGAAGGIWAFGKTLRKNFVRADLAAATPAAPTE